MGKYQNEIDDLHFPPGWSDWQGRLNIGGETGGINDNGTSVPYGAVTRTW